VGRVTVGDVAGLGVVWYGVVLGEDLGGRGGEGGGKVVGGRGEVVCLVVVCWVG
jgi:hypothetical protein